MDNAILVLPYFILPLIAIGFLLAFIWRWVQGVREYYSESCPCCGHDDIRAHAVDDVKMRMCADCGAQWERVKMEAK